MNICVFTITYVQIESYSLNCIQCTRMHEYARLYVRRVCVCVCADVQLIRKRCINIFEHRIQQIDLMEIVGSL